MSEPEPLLIPKQDHLSEQLSVLVVGTVGEVRAVITNGRNHPPEVWTQLIMRRLLSISDESLVPTLRDQIHAFKDKITELIHHNIVQALNDQREHTATMLEEAGHKVAGGMVRAKRL